MIKRGERRGSSLDVGRLRIIDEPDAADHGDRLQSVGDTGKTPKALGDGLGRQPKAECGRPGCHRIGHVVVPDQSEFRAIEQPVAINGDRVIFEPKVNRQIILSGWNEPHDGRLSGWIEVHQGRIALVEHRNIPFDLVDEDPLLDPAVLSHASVAVKVVRRQIEVDRALRSEELDVFKLERRALADDSDLRPYRPLREAGQRAADVSYRMDCAARRSQNMGDELGRRRLAVGAGDADEVSPD